MATITFFLTVAVVGILLKPELYESKTTVIKENNSMQSEVDEKNIESEISNQEEWGSGDVYTLIFVLAGVAARIAYVNITAEKPIIEYYSENEWAGLNGSYIRSWEENTEGYSVKIVGYVVMEKEKYFSKYDLSGKDQSVADPFAYIMEVTIKIKNEENETGKLQIADWALIGKNDDFIAYLDQQLLMDTDERVDSILSSISTASGKEIEIKLPYPLIYMDKEKEIDRNMPYKIAVTKYPSRKYIQFG